MKHAIDRLVLRNKAGVAPVSQAAEKAVIVPVLGDSFGFIDRS